MSTFRFSRTAIDDASLRTELADPACGGFAAFEGRVRDHNDGHRVRHLEYEAFEPLAVKEGERIIAQAMERFGVQHAICVHRVGDLALGETAVWVGVSASHRHEAFLACRYIIDEVKQSVPIWKKEHYESGDSGWVNCERCATPAHQHGPSADYSRQMALKEVGAAGQAKLRASRALVVGCGGLGVPVIGYLAGAGIGQLGLADGDRLEASNLHRQTLYALADVGKPKAELAAARARALNPDTVVRTHNLRLDASTAADLIGQYDLIIDCTDNFATKFLLNDLCVQLGKPVIFSSVYQYEGQLQVVRGDRGGACLRCIWPQAMRDGLIGNCAQAGVLGPVPGVFGCLQALEALKILLDLPGQLTEELLVLDLLTLASRRLRSRKAADCPAHAVPKLESEMTDSDELELAFESLDDAAAQGFLVLDIREPYEVAELPAPGASVQLIPMGQLLQADAQLEPSRKYLLVCASGRRSLTAAAELRARGIAGAYSLPGGVHAFYAR